ncbi:G protein coupled receptor fragment [Echinococcus multilocularis]|uniref:G protein coupled receptor n=1 Tax=Echinococcus multilocularis TaxID=6211 RepID=A0A068YE88_ECHMU|nr:G protein coupled receptor fragment [Echinococcus multilocularis]
MNLTENYTKFLACQRDILEYVRKFGLGYFGVLIFFGTIGNIISLLVIRGVRQTYHQPSCQIQKEPSEERGQEFAALHVGSRRNSPVRVTPENSQVLSFETTAGSPKPSGVGVINQTRFSIVSPSAIPKRQPMRKHPSKSIFTALAIADTVALWVNPIRYWILFAFGFDIRQNNSVTMCRLHTFLTYATRDIAIWVLCLLTFERYLIGCFPHKAKIIWRGRRKVSAWVGIFSVILAKNSILIFILQLIYPDDVGELVIVGPSYAELNTSRLLLCDTLDLTSRRVFFYLDIVIYSLVPTGLLLVLNIALFRVIQRRNVMCRRCEFFPKSDNVGAAPMEDSMRNSMSMQLGSLKIIGSVVQANQLLIPVGVFHLITSVPICIFSIVEDAMQLKRSPSAYARCVVNACGYLLVMLGATTYGVNCLIYFLSSRQFRERLYALTYPTRLVKEVEPTSYFLDPRDTVSPHQNPKGRNPKEGTLVESMELCADALRS